MNMNKKNRDLFNTIYRFIGTINKSWDPKLTIALLKSLDEFRMSDGLTPHFVDQITKLDSFHERVWEMLLFRRLKLSGLSPAFGKDGQPDFFLSKQGIWIEATSPKPKGVPNYYLEIPKKSEVMAYEVPHEEIILRWTAAIDAKQKKLKEYQQKGIVNKEHGFIIAVSGYQLGEFSSIQGISGYPYPVEVAYGVGPIMVPFYKDPQIQGQAFISHREDVLNVNETPICTKLFFQDKYKDVSAILGTISGVDHALLCNQEIFVMVHNPLAVNPIKKGLLKNCIEYQVQFIDKDKYRIEEIEAEKGCCENA